MKETSGHSHFTPDGWHTVTPRIMVHDAERLVAFLEGCSGQQATLGQIYHPR